MSRLRLLLVTGQALDSATFALFFLVVPAVILSQLETAERNPLVAALFAIGGFIAVVGAKMGITAWVVWRDGHRANRPKKTAAMLFVAGAAGFVGAGFNLFALFTVLTILGVA